MARAYTRREGENENPPHTPTLMTIAAVALLLSAARASDSSTLDWAAFASMPAALSAARSSLLVRPCALAISCTRFFAI